MSRETAELDQLVTALVDAIAERAETWYGPGVGVPTLASVQIRPWSIFARFAIGGTSRGAPALLVKIRRHPHLRVADAIGDAGLRQEGRDDFETLVRLERVTVGSAAYSAVRALDFIEELSALVMEELPAEPLKRRLTSVRAVVSRRTKSRLEEVFERAGSLLRVFHEEVGPVGLGPLVDGEVITGVLADLALVEARSSDVRVGELREVVTRVAEYGGRVNVPHSRLHRDFNSVNIMVTNDDRVVLLDPRMLPGPVHRDIAKLMVDVETFSLQGLTHGLFLGHAADALSRAVVRGYSTASEPDPIALEFYKLVSILDKWRYDDERAARLVRGRTLRAADARVVAWRRRYLATLTERQREHLTAALAGRRATGARSE